MKTLEDEAAGLALAAAGKGEAGARALARDIVRLALEHAGRTASAEAERCRRLAKAQPEWAADARAAWQGGADAAARIAAAIDAAMP